MTEGIWAMSRGVIGGAERLYCAERCFVGAVSVSFCPLLEMIQVVWDLQALELAERSCLLSNGPQLYCRAIYCHSLSHSKYTSHVYFDFQT